ncbi:phage tail protein, partial [Streptomyces cyaneofuscatus]
MDDLDGSVRRVSGRLGGVRGSLGSTSNATRNATGNTKNLIMAAVALGTALIPIAAATAPLAAGLAASGVAIGAFGVAVAGQIVALAEAAEAENKYQDAITEHGRASKEAVKAEGDYLRSLADMPLASREAAAALTVLKDEYGEWSDALSNDTMPIVTKSMGLFRAMLPPLTPLVRGTSKELDRLLNVAAGGMTTPGFDRFMKSFTEFATETLARGTTHLTNFTRSLNSGEFGRDMREFLDYAKANGPLVGETLMNLARAVTTLLVAMSDMGVSVLTAVNAFAQLINAIPTSFLSTLLQLYAGFKLVTLGAAAFGAVTGSAAVARLGAYFAIMRAAGVGTTLRATAASMTAMTKASIGLGVLAVAAIGVAKLAENARGAPPDVDRLTTSLKRLAETGKFTGELKKTFGDVDGLVKKIGEIGDAAKENEDYVKSFANSGIGPLDDLRSGANELWQDFTKGEKSLTALEDDFKGLDQAMAGMVQSGYGKQAAADFSMIEAAAKKAGYSTKEIAALFPDYQAAVAAAAAEQELAVAGMGLFGQQALDVKTKLDAQKASADGLRGAIQALNDVNRAALGGMIGFEAAIDAADKAAKKNAGSLTMVNGELDLNSPKAQAAATALQDLGTKTDEAAASAREQGRSWEYVNGIYQRGEQAIIKAGQAMGLTKPQAEALAKTLLDIPDSKEFKVKMRTDDATADLNAFNAKVKASPGSKSVTLK